MLRWSSLAVNESSTTRTIGAAAGSAAGAGPGPVTSASPTSSACGSISSAILPSPSTAAPRNLSAPASSGPSGLTAISCWPTSESQATATLSSVTRMTRAGARAGSGDVVAPTSAATSASGTGRPRTASIGLPCNASALVTVTTSATAASGNP